MFILGAEDLQFFGEKNAYGIDIAAMSIFESHIIPVNIHNLSKQFSPDLS